MKDSERSTQKTGFRTNMLFVATVAVICTLLWGSAFPCIKTGYEIFHIAPEDIPSKLIFAGARFLPAGGIVLCIGLIRHPREMKLKKSDILPVSLLSLFQTFLQYLLLYAGIGEVSGTRSAIYTSLSAFGSVILSAVFFRGDRLTLRKILGCAVGVTGIAAMGLSGGDGGGVFLLGDLLVILSNLSGAAGNVVSKKISTRRSPVMISGWQLVLGGSALILTGYSLGGRLYFYDAGCVFLLLYLAAMAGVAFMLWTMLLSYNNVSRVAVFSLLIPVFGAMWSGIFLGENIFTPANIISLTLVSSGILIVNMTISKFK